MRREVDSPDALAKRHNAADQKKQRNELFHGLESTVTPAVVRVVSSASAAALQDAWDRFVPPLRSMVPDVSPDATARASRMSMLGDGGPAASRAHPLNVRLNPSVNVAFVNVSVVSADAPVKSRMLVNAVFGAANVVRLVLLHCTIEQSVMLLNTKLVTSVVENPSVVGLTVAGALNVARFGESLNS